MNSSGISVQFYNSCERYKCELYIYCHVIAHGDEEVRLILFSRGESALSSSQKVTVKRECGSRRGDQVFALSDLRSPDIGRGKREKPK